MQYKGFTLERVKRRAKGPRQSFRAALIRALRLGLTKETTFFSVPNDGAHGSAGSAIGSETLAGIPDLIFIHHGRAFGLELKTRNGGLSDHQRAAQVALRDAGMRVEVARDLHEALMHVRDMGIPLHVRNADLRRRGDTA